MVRSLLAILVLAIGIETSAAAPNTKDASHPHCQLPYRDSGARASNQAPDLAAAGFLEALCAPGVAVQGHAILLWQQAVEGNSAFLDRITKKETTIELLAAHAKNERADATSRVAAIEAVTAISTKFGDKRALSTLTALATNSDLHSDIGLAAIKGLTVIFPKNEVVVGYASGHIALPPKITAEILDIFLSVQDLAPAEQVLLRAIEIVRSEGRRRDRRLARTPTVSNVVKLATRLPEEARLRLLDGFSGLELSTIQSDLRISDGALKSHLRKRLQETASLQQLQSALGLIEDLSAQIKKEISQDVANVTKRILGQSSAGSDLGKSILQSLSQWDDPTVKDFAKRIQAQAEPNPVRTSPNPSDATSLIERLSKAKGPAREQLLVEVVQAAPASNIVEALQKSPSTRRSDLNTLRAFALKNEKKFEEDAVEVLGVLNTTETRSENLSTFSRLVLQNKGTNAEQSALDWFEKIATPNETLKLARDVVRQKKGGSIEAIALGIIGRLGSADDDRALILELIKPSNGNADSAISAMLTLKITPTGADLSNVVREGTSRQAIIRAIETIEGLGLRQQHVVLRDILQAGAAAGVQTTNATRPQEDIQVLRAALRVLRALQKSAPFSAQERRDIGRSVVELLRVRRADSMRAELQQFLVELEMTGALGDTLEAATRPAQLEKRREITLTKDLVSALQLAGEPIPTIMAIFPVLRRNALETDRMRALAHLAGGGDAKAEVLIASLGADPPINRLLERLDVQGASVVLAAYAEGWKHTDNKTEKTQIAAGALQVAQKICARGQHADESLTSAFVSWFRELVQGAATGPADCSTGELAQKLGQIAQNMKDEEIFGHTVLQDHIRKPIYLAAVENYWPYLLIHPAAWIVLLLAYPKSRAVQSFFFWNKWGRTFFGLGYVHLAVTYVPYLRHHILAPLEPNLIAGGGEALLGPEPFFAEIEAIDASTRKSLGRAIDVVLGKSNGASGAQNLAAGPLIIEGESGLGKSLLLRETARVLRAQKAATVVFLQAIDCAEGVEKAILDRSELNLSAEEGYVRTLLHIGALVLVIDGVNEVTAETRTRISTFVSRNRRGRILLATQPIVWRAPDSIPRIVLKPLRAEQINGFLKVYAAHLPAEAKITQSEYDRRVEAFAVQVTQNPNAERTRVLLSNPMMLSIVSNLIATEESPEVGKLIDENLVERAVTNAESNYANYLPGSIFPRKAFADMIFMHRCENKMRFPSSDFVEAWEVLRAAKIARPGTGIDVSGIATDYLFRHETFLAFYLGVALFPAQLAEIWDRYRTGKADTASQKELYRWLEKLDKIETFRTAYLLFADTGPERDVKAVAEAWKQRWLATDDRFYREYEARLARRFPHATLLAANDLGPYPLDTAV